jgi:hypothetical protein
MIGWLMNNKLEILKGTFVAKLNPPSRFLEWLRKTMKLNQDSLYPSQESNPRPPEYEAGMPTQLRHHFRSDPNVSDGLISSLVLRGNI